MDYESNFFISIDLSTKQRIAFFPNQTEEVITECINALIDDQSRTGNNPLYNVKVSKMDHDKPFALSTALKKKLFHLGQPFNATRLSRPNANFSLLFDTSTSTDEMFDMLTSFQHMAKHIYSNPNVISNLEQRRYKVTGKECKVL
jgi:hypothetical protein